MMGSHEDSDVDVVNVKRQDLSEEISLLDEKIKEARCALSDFRSDKDISDSSNALQAKALREQFHKRQQQWQERMLDFSESSSLKGRRKVLLTFLEDMKQAHLSTQPEDTETTTSRAPPVRVLANQARLLYAMHANFCALPHQQLLLQESQEDLLDYFDEAYQQELLEQQRATQPTFQQVSQVAQANHDLYDDYQRQLKALETEIRSLQSLLPKNQEEDVLSLCSATQYSGESEDYLTSTSRGTSNPGKWKFSDLQDSWSTSLKERVVNFAVEQLGKIPA